MNKIDCYVDAETGQKLSAIQATCEWIEEFEVGYGDWSCNNCGVLWTFEYPPNEDENFNFCPKCGLRILNFIGYKNLDEDNEESK
jgi:hypothetical protein